ncbi:Mitochondrial import inner membrane translocase subunit Tim21-like, partial [Homarus americanus]
TNVMIFLPLHKFICQRCMASQLSNHTWMSIINNRQFNTNHNLQNVRKSVSKHVRSDTSGGFGHKAKEATRTTYYTAVVVLGVGVTGLMMYSVFKELLFSFSPQTVYSAAVENHLSYEVEGNKGLRIKFHLKGQRRTATANLDARETSSGWEFRYLFVQLDSYPYEVIVIEDNRGTVFDSSSSAELSSLPGT